MLREESAHALTRVVQLGSRAQRLSLPVPQLDESLSLALAAETFAVVKSSPGLTSE